MRPTWRPILPAILVLFLYMDSFDGKTRAQYIRVMPDGTLHPASRMMLEVPSKTEQKEVEP